MTSEDKVELIARAIAEHVHHREMRWSLREINQEDQFENWLKAYPVKVTEAERELARVVLTVLEQSAACNNS